MAHGTQRVQRERRRPGDTGSGQLRRASVACRACARGAACGAVDSDLILYSYPDLMREATHFRYNCSRSSYTLQLLSRTVSKVIEVHCTFSKNPIFSLLHKPKDPSPARLPGGPTPGHGRTDSNQHLARPPTRRPTAASAASPHVQAQHISQSDFLLCVRTGRGRKSSDGAAGQ